MGFTSTRRLTASRLDLAEACPASHAIEWQADTSIAAENGTHRHAFTERAANGDRDGALELLPEHLREQMSRVDLDTILEAIPGKPRAEVPFAYDPATDTARELPQSNGRRDYSSVRPGEIPGTVDLLGWDDKRGGVLDYKTGAGWVSSAKESRQIHFAALAVSRVARVDLVDGAVAKIDEDGGAALLRARFDDMALDGAAHELRVIQERVAKATPADTVLGDHCRWCPARRACPARAQAGQQLVALVERKPTWTPDLLGKAWTLARAVGNAVDEVKDECRAAVRAGVDVPLPNGKRLGFVEQTRESIVVEAAIQQANEMDMNIGSVLAASTLSKASVAEHLGAEQAMRLIDSVRRANGMRTQVVEQLRELKAEGAPKRKPKPSPTADAFARKAVEQADAEAKSR